MDGITKLLHICRKQKRESQGTPMFNSQVSNKRQEEENTTRIKEENQTVYLLGSTKRVSGG